MAKIDLWKDRDKKVVEPTLFSKTAMDLAKRIAEAGQKKGKDGGPAVDEHGKYERNRASQIRKFYDEIMRLNTMSKTRQAQWDAILPMVHMVTAKAAYAEGRKLTTKDFTDFIRESVDQVQEEKDLDVFANLFEAFMGYYKLHGPKN